MVQDASAEVPADGSSDTAACGMAAEPVRYAPREVLGLRWFDVDLKAKTLTVDQGRVLVDYEVRIEEPKSRNGKRTLPLDGARVAALADLRKCQAKESQRAGSAYRARIEDLSWHAAGAEYVVSDELGIPLHPEAYSDEFTRMLKRAGLPKIRLHDSRHTTFSLMEKAGVPISIISKWAGHYDSSFTMKTYVHASAEDLEQGAGQNPSAGLDPVIP